MDELAESIKTTWPGMTVFFDLDGTFARWQSMHSFLLAMVREGLFPTVVKTMLKKDLRMYRERRGEFKDFIDCLVSVFRQRLPGIRVEDAIFVANRMIEYQGDHVHVFSRELLYAAHELGLTSAFVSGSPEVVVQAFAKYAGVKIFLGNEYPERDGTYIEGEPKQWVLNKGEALRHLARTHALKLEDSVAVGDSESDVPMFECVRWPLCFNPNRRLLALARKRHWPVIVERKDSILVMKPDISGYLQEAPLASILPQWFAGKLGERLKI